MEHNDTNRSLLGLRYDDNSKQNLKATAIWAGIVAVLSLAGAVLSLIEYFVNKNRSANVYRYEGFQDDTLATPPEYDFVWLFIMMAITGFLFYYLNRFSRLTKTGIDGNDQQRISDGLASLASYFKIIGVLLIIGLVLCILSIPVLLTYNQ